jgi:hypothetical protein
MHAPRRRLAIAVVLAIVMHGIGCSSPSSPSPAPVAISLHSSAWQTISDPQPYPLANDGAALTFELPSSGSINYLFTAVSIPNLHGTLSVTVRIATSGPVLFNSLDPQTSACTIPSSVRPLIWANNNGNGEFDRWWSNPRSITLAAGTHTINVPLTADSWSSVNGKFANADGPTTLAFGHALLNVSRLGLTFGGGCSFGHGVNVQNGTAAFALTDYSVR